MHRGRKIELTNKCRLIFNMLPSDVKGNKSLAQLTVNRILEVAENTDEFKYMTDVISIMIENTKGKELTQKK